MIWKGKFMRTTIMMSVKPLLLGNSAKSLKIAFSLFLRYSLSSYIFVKDIPFFYRFIPFVSCLRLSESSDDRFVFMSIEHFTREYGESTYLLIPCTEKYRDFVDNNREILENKFIIRSPDEILNRSEIFPITANGKDL